MNSCDENLYEIDQRPKIYFFSEYFFPDDYRSSFITSSLIFVSVPRSVLKAFNVSMYTVYRRTCFYALLWLSLWELKSLNKPKLLTLERKSVNVAALQLSVSRVYCTRYLNKYIGITILHIICIDKSRTITYISPSNCRQKFPGHYDGVVHTANTK